MCRAAAAEVMPLHEAGKPTPLAGSNDVNQFVLRKNIDLYLIAGIGGFVTLNGGPVPALFQLTTNVTSVVLNASAFTSAFHCEGGAENFLTYHWALAPTSTNAFTGSVSGTNTSVLTIPANSLATGSYIFRLTVTDTFDGSMTQKDFPVQFLRP